MSGYKYGQDTLLSKSTTSASWAQFADGFLQGIPNAFINTNTGWQYTDSAVEYVNLSATSNSNNTAIRTRQIYNSNSGYYIRFWFTSSYNGQGNYSDLRINSMGVKSTDYDNTAVTGTNASFFNYKNLSSIGHTSTNYSAPLFCFAVKKSSINVDYGSDLETLSGIVTLADYCEVVLDSSAATSFNFYSQYYKFIAISNSTGDKFALGYHRFDQPKKMILCLAGDILENFDSTDTNKFAIFSKGPRNGLFPHNNSNTATSPSDTWPNTNSVSYITLFTKSGEQIRDNIDKYANYFVTDPIVINSNYDYINYTKVLLSVDSTTDLAWEKIGNGQPVKGWIDPSFLRYIGTSNYSSDVLKTYDNGNFIQIADGYLLGWDPSNPSLT